eukprot:TRINITY_DN1962_c0_g1_i4.p1 TRINITY_DN1962_c0_g1~~TRINITY_DN1962_c0_g1_i4.p1  ORF type:complete len:798 (+),score=131.04 TRINITY_DN1962_c0_g1_i4:95-2488(+)
MGCCCMGCSRAVAVLPEQPLDHRVYVEPAPRNSRTKVWESALKGGGHELMRFNRVENLQGCTGADRPESFPVGVLVLTELFLWWHSYPSLAGGQDSLESAEQKQEQHGKAGATSSSRSLNRHGSSLLVGYGAIDAVSIVACGDGDQCCAVRIVTNYLSDSLEIVFRLTEGPDALNEWTTTIPENSGAEGSSSSSSSSSSSDTWHQTFAAALDRALKSYHWAQHFLHCALRQRDLFAHRSNAELPELALLPNEELTECFSDILNFGASQEDLVGHLIVTNCRVVWALDRDRTTYNVSVPHRAHAPSLTETTTFGLCMVLFIQQPFMNNSGHNTGMRLGFGAGSARGVERRERLEQILAHIKAVQGRYLEDPKYGVADYMCNRRQYQVHSHVRLLDTLSRFDSPSDEITRPDVMESNLQGEACECVICLDQVCNEGPLAYLLAAGKLGWACRHIFHLQCAQNLQAQKCPVCRSTFSEVREMPDIRRNPGAWFDAMDVDRTGDLDLEEVVGALTVVLPVDRDKLETLLRPEIHKVPASAYSDLWRQWDKEGTGRITRQAFEDPEGGLLVWILARLKLLHRGQRARPCLAAAVSQETLGRWFDFWDWSKVGFLTRGQISRAVAREFEGRLPDMMCLELVEDVWRNIVEATISKPVAPPSPVVEVTSEDSRQVPDEDPGSPSQGQEDQDRLSTAYADPWHLREGICSRGDFLEGGLGSALRIKILDLSAERSAAGRHRQLSRDAQALFHFDDALAVADNTSGIAGNRILRSLGDCAGQQRRPVGEPETITENTEQTRGGWRI